jgi:hypothetical protein
MTVLNIVLSMGCLYLTAGAAAQVMGAELNFARTKSKIPTKSPSRRNSGNYL